MTCRGFGIANSIFGRIFIEYDDYMDDYGVYQGNIDNPFMYLIRDKETGEVWQIGAVYFPTSFYQ